jgi:hypothetical protein
MNTRERFHAVMQGRPFDRLPLLGKKGQKKGSARDIWCLT